MGNLPKLSEGTALQVGKHKVTVVKYLSEGGFAQIYKVTIDPLENDSEIACLKRVIVPDKNGLNELRKEVDVMKTLRHSRNIVKYYDSHAERLENGTYQVLVLMELCPNGSLLDYMNKHIKTKLTEPQILRIMLDICQGIYEMHKLKLIHRDIKIENVLIDSKNQFQLCDFGSTAVPTMPPQDQQQFNYLSHDILYHTTPQYRSPEMVDLYRGIPIDEKADIWALGCFLYKLCYYTTPFEANGDIAILHASFQFPPYPEFSGDLKNLIIIMLQENPLFRPNIVQVLILVCKLMNIDFANLKLKDFYNAGPYNFQALHEYQVHKQNELMRQKQLYYQQQALANSEAGLTKEQERLAQPVSAEDSLPTEENSQSQPNKAAATATIDSQPSPEIKSTTLGVPSTLTSGSSRESLAGFSLEDDLANEIAEIEGLEDAEQRYPSLEEIEVPDKIIQKSTEPLRLTSIKTSYSEATSSKGIDAHGVDVDENLDYLPKPNKVAEKLADDIFSVTESPTFPVKEKFDETGDAARSKTDTDGDFYDLLQRVEHLHVETDQSGSAKNPFPCVKALAATKEDGNFEQPETRKKNNPWGNYNLTPKENYTSTSTLDSFAFMQNSGSVPSALSEMKLVPVATETIFPSTQTEPPKIAKPECNLIDLEVGLESSSASPSLRYLKSNNISEVSLIDMDDSQFKTSEAKVADQKPAFKKRVGSNTHNPSQFSLQEEVIDFASDDENPANGSYMNRLKIRSSLKKPSKGRRSGEHKRTESSSTDSKKRLSFFGGN